MSDATGLGLLDVLLLESFDAAGARPERPHVKSLRTLDVLEFEHGIAPDIGYRAMCELARPDRQHLRLVDFLGNHGSADFGPASPRFTESRLTPLGMAALAAERGAGVALPIGLVNGNMYLAGRRPPLHPRRAMAALRAAAGAATDDEIAGLVGPPQFPTQCRVAGDIAGLLAGGEVELTLRPRFAELPRANPFSWREIRIDAIPPTTGASEIAQTIAGQPPRGVLDVNDHSAGGVTDLRVALDAEAVVADVISDLETMWPVRTTVDAWLRAPIGTILRDWVGGLTGADLEASLGQIADAMVASAGRES